jgi:hypothetical protein
MATKPEAAPGRAPRRWRTALRRLMGEPLVHFLIAGSVLFAAGEAYRRHTDIYRIEVAPRHVEQLASAYALQFGAKPDAATLDELVRRDVHDEMLYRQGLALKLDRDDEIVRRRVIQKMQFLMQDLNPPAEPTAAQLGAYYQAHAAKYAVPAKATFSHVYFSAQGLGDAAARAKAIQVLRTLPAAATRAPGRGDPFPDLYDFAGYDPAQVGRLFGDSEFTRAVFTAPVGQWSGPYRSGYGWHLVRIEARQAPSQPPLATVRESVRDDYLEAAQGASNERAFDKLAQRFQVVRPKGAPRP